MIQNTDLIDEERLISDDVAQKVIDEVSENCKKFGSLSIRVSSWWGGGHRWSRNRIKMNSDRRETFVSIRREHHRATSIVSTNQIDSVSLKGACDLLEYNLSKWGEPGAYSMPLVIPKFESAGISVWDDESYKRNITDNLEYSAQAIENAEEQGLYAAGYIETIAANVRLYQRDSWNRDSLQTGQITQAQCSSTVRHPNGLGSGWAGESDFGWNRISIKSVSALALDKCTKSLNPVRLEPGRYQTILEPQAVATLAIAMVSALSRIENESQMSRYTLGRDASIGRFRTKLGLRIVDQRINIFHDPNDTDFGTHKTPGMEHVQLVENGVLRTLYNSVRHAVNELHEEKVDLGRTSFVMTGSNFTEDSQIEHMKSGLLVSRISNIQTIDNFSQLLTGLTRDGLWLVENGKITKSVRNLRWTESPLFAFNNVEMIGPTVPVFSPVKLREVFSDGFQNSRQTVAVPTMTINDFSFTSTTDAI